MDNLPQPEIIEGYYSDIAVYAFPTPKGTEFSTDVIHNDEVADKLLSLVKDGAQIILEDGPGIISKYKNEKAVQMLYRDDYPTAKAVKIRKYGKGQIIQAPFLAESLAHISIKRDLEADEKGKLAQHLDWTHRNTEDFDIYFISNQQENQRDLTVKIRTSGKIPEFFNPQTGSIQVAKNWKFEGGITELPVKLAANESVFIVLQKTTGDKSADEGFSWAEYKKIFQLDSFWKVSFDESYGGPRGTIIFSSLTDWAYHDNDSIKYYSGKATYTTVLFLAHPGEKSIFLEL